MPQRLLSSETAEVISEQRALLGKKTLRSCLINLNQSAEDQRRKVSLQDLRLILEVMIVNDLVSVTDKALSHIRTDLQSANENYVRLSVKGGGCSGLMYDVKFDSKQETDLEIVKEGVVFVMDKKSSIYLKGLELDFEPGINSKGLIFRNPNASNTCGCGESFSI